MSEINVLILSAGTRNLVVRAFREELKGRGRVIATDASPLGPAIYDADAAYVVPRITDPAYLDTILDICRKEKVTGVLSLIDPELSLIAEHRAEFEAVGTTPVVSSKELCDASLEKPRMIKMFQDHGLSTQKYYLTLDELKKAHAAGEIDFPVFIKPRAGSASIGISKVDSMELAELLMRSDPELMAQELMTGQEYGADAYIDMISGKCTHIFLKKKIKMRAGETDKSVSVKDEKAFALISSFAEKAGFRGMIDIDLFHVEDESAPDFGTWYFSEVNPRFGGGNPHAMACGVNMPAAVVKNLAGEAGEVRIGDYEEGVYMMKYNSIAVLRENELA